MAQGSKQYHLNRYYKRKSRLLELLGGKCVKCGTTDKLQFDHIDPTTKSFTLGVGMFKPWAVLLEEVNKCQLLCPECHNKKTVEINSGKQIVKGMNIHGTVSSYRYCKCADCKIAHKVWYENWRKTHSRKDRPGTGKVRGEKHHQTKLTEAQVYEILASSEPHSYFSQKYSVSKTTISQIRNNIIWKHIPRPS